MVSIWTGAKKPCGMIVLALTAFAGNALADFLTPSFRGLADTTYQAWDVFTSLEGPNPPDVALSNPNGIPNVRELTGAGFVPSSGNLYVQAGVGDFEATVPDYNLGGGFVTNVVVQVRTQGSTLDLDSVLWNGMAWDESELLFEQPLGGGFGGVVQDWMFAWNLLPGSTAVNVLTFQAADLSLSLDRLSIDTQTVAVPEAGTLLLGSGSFGLVAAALYLQRRRGRDGSTRRS